jgi:pyridoxamine 5'-phosphate oxidase family protein
MFTQNEIEFLNTQRLARIATVSSDGQPDVAPVGYSYDGVHFKVGGRNPAVTLKHKNVAAGNTQVALVVDDLETTDPWKPRGIKVHGTAEVIEREGKTPYLLITPISHWTWGIEGSSFTIQKKEHPQS